MKFCALEKRYCDYCGNIPKSVCEWAFKMQDDIYMDCENWVESYLYDHYQPEMYTQEEEDALDEFERWYKEEYQGKEMDLPF